MPQLQWVGKDKVINYHLSVPYRVLKKTSSFGDNIDKNMIIHGDNITALKSLLPEFEGNIDVIYIDPPYNTGNEKWVYNDNLNDPRFKKWIGEVVGKEGEDLDRHDKWLCMMYPRLKLLQKLLSPSGRIFISIDENELYSLKLICDEIFGLRNFVGQYMWFRSATPPNLSYKIKKNLEYVLCYEKELNNQKYFGIKKTSPSDDPFTKPQNSIKDLSFKPGSIHFKGADGTISAGTYGTAKFPNILLNDLVVKDGVNENTVVFRNRFIWVQTTLDENLNNKLRVNLSKQLVLSYKRAEYSPEVPPNLIDDTVGVNTTEEAGKLLEKLFGKNPFEYPKDVSLIKYLLNFVPKKDAVILDAFAGSGTTGQAVEELNAADGGHRRFVLVEMGDYADTITAERIRKTGGAFDYYEIGPVLFDEDGFLNPEVSDQEIQKYIWFSETKGQNCVYCPDGYYLGSVGKTSIYFCFKKDDSVALSLEFFKKLPHKSESYIIYADSCTVSPSDLLKNNINFKKIPFGIRTL